MTLLYVLADNSYIDVKSIAKDQKIDQKFYINVTNECPCNCTFCLRQTKQMLQENSLWLKTQPTGYEFITELKKYDLSLTPEIIFCGFGEPLTKLDILLDIATYLRKQYPMIKLRLNTNGLANLYHSKDITPEFKGLINTISISLNASNKEDYLKLTQSSFGIESFDAMLDFARLANKYVENVVLSVVDILSDDELEKCHSIADSINVNFKIRPFEK